MRKLLLVAMLAISTLAWAHGAKKTDQTSQAGQNWYQAMLDRNVDQRVKLNQTISPAATAFAERETFQQPGSMAAQQGGTAGDFYDQKVQIQSEVNRRDLGALKSAMQ